MPEAFNGSFRVRAYDPFLLGIVETDSLAGLDRRDGHRERDGMAVTGFDAGIRRFSATHALHPVAHVRGGGFVHSAAGALVDRTSCVGERTLLEEIRLHSHFFSVPVFESAFG